jgi:hypothetical protein
MKALLAACLIMAPTLAESFEEKLHQLEQEKPHLFMNQAASANTKNNYYKRINQCALVLGIAYCLQSYYQHYLTGNSSKSYLAQAAYESMPSLFSSTPTHISFALQSLEGMIKAYVVKLIGTWLVWGFVEEE